MDTTTDPSPFDDGDFYDILCQNLTYGIDFYVDLARQARGPILEIACGTGRILLPCLQAGADGDGVDLYQPMLDTLRRKATALGLAPNLYRADMADFHLPRRYALITITFNAFIHNLTQEAQIRCLDLCRQHLLPGGLLAFDTYFPSLAILTAPENTRALEAEMRDPRTGLLLRMYDTRRFDPVRQIQHSLTEVEQVNPDGSIEIIHRWEFDVRWIWKEEMALLLRLAGFSRWEIYGNFERAPLTQQTDMLIVQAWAAV